MAKSNKLKAWVRYDGQKKIVPSSLILQANKPKVGTWVEISTDLCCGVTPCPAPDYGAWRLVTGGEAGDGVVLVDSLIDNEFTFVGPNDDADNGWVYLTRYFTEPTILEINYNWTSFDDTEDGPPEVDWPVFWFSPTEPTGVPGDSTVRVNNTPSSGTWFVPIPASSVEPIWFSIGILSSDSCCGRGFLSININELPFSYFTYLITTLPEDNADATGNTPGNPSIGPDGNIYYAYDGFVFDSTGGATSTPLTNSPICAAYSPYVFYFKNNSYVLIDRPGTVVSTGTPC